MQTVRRFTIVVAGVLALAALATGFWLLRRSTSPGGMTRGGQPGAPARSPGVGQPLFDPAECDVVADAAAREECRKIGLYDWANRQAAAAAAAGTIDACGKLHDARSRDTCRLRYITAGGKVGGCQQLEDEDRRAGCRTQFLSRGDDFLACTTLASAVDRTYCQQQVIASHRAEGPAYCDRYEGPPRAACLERYWKDLAMEQTDYKLCEKIADPAAVRSCLDLLPPDGDGDALSDYYENAIYDTDPGKPDTDGDGLDDYDEVKTYQTNPQRPDTDGDGYPDGEEVKAGFDPKGPGKLKP